MTQTAKNSGRPKDLAASAAIKKAALEMITEHGYSGVSIGAIAKSAGVARQTLYNRWNTKADLVLDAVFDAAERNAEPPVLHDDTAVRPVLLAFLTRIFEHLAHNGATLGALIAAAQEDLTFQKVFYDSFVRPRQEIITDLLRQAQIRGELDQNRDAEMLSLFVHGTFWYALLNGQTINGALAARVMNEIMPEPTALP